jgi:ferredoxin
MECEQKKPTIQPGCIGCGLCEAIAPEVFEVRNVSRVKEGAQYDQYKDKIKKAELSCPVGVIRYEKE